MGLFRVKNQSLKLHSKLRSKTFNVERLVPKTVFALNYIMLRMKIYAQLILLINLKWARRVKILHFKLSMFLWWILMVILQPMKSIFGTIKTQKFLMYHQILHIRMNKNHFFLKQIFLGMMEIIMKCSKNLEILHADLQVAQAKKLSKLLWKFLLLANSRRKNYLIKSDAEVQSGASLILSN